MSLTLTRTDEEIIARFRSLRTAHDVAGLLEVTYSDLTYHLYRRPLKNSYIQFVLTKRNGGTRKISAPASALKILQRKLNYALQLIYTPKKCVQGFVRDKSVLTNAQTHPRRSRILNIDLRDFFPSINFGRVRGMFIAKPYSVPEKAATVLAQLCCYDGHLPQGSPSSPIVANMVCEKLDSDCLRLARRFRCTYTRYADDITFSTTRNSFPSSLACLIHDNESMTVDIGPALRSTIEENGFEINSGKVRLQGRGTRQEVTGLVVNRMPNVPRKYIRSLRAAIYAIATFGLEAAQKDFHKKHYHKQIRSDRDPPALTTVLEGRFSYLKMIKGEADPVYRALWNRYQKALDKPIKYVTDPLRDLSPSLWVIYADKENPIGQGTAFMLRNTGLVTCQHVLRPTMQAFQWTTCTERRELTTIAENRDLDVAILKLEPDGNYASLERGDPSSVHQGDRLILAGFPGYRFGDTPYITEGRVASFRIISTLKWIILSTPIVAGNSGGPVLDKNGHVIGIAATGIDRIEHAEKTEHYGIIPITALDYL